MRRMELCLAKNKMGGGPRGSHPLSFEGVVRKATRSRGYKVKLFPLLRIQAVKKHTLTDEAYLFKFTNGAP